MISVNNRTKTVSAPAASPAVQPEARAEKQKAAYAPAGSEDGVTISPEARAAMARQAASAGDVPEKLPDTPEAAPFPSFADVFSQVTEKYSSQIRDHYAKEHSENLTYADPYAHVWNKYKNPDSPDFRACLSNGPGPMTRSWTFCMVESICKWAIPTPSPTERPRCPPRRQRPIRRAGNSSIWRFRIS